MITTILSATTLFQQVSWGDLLSRIWPEVLSFVVLAFVVGQLQRFLECFIHRRPKDIHITGRSSFFGEWFTGFRYHLVAINIIREGYKKASGNLFAVPALGKYVVFASTRDQIEEVSKAPMSQLSFNDAVDEQFLPHLVFNGFKFDSKHPIPVAPVHALKTRLRDNLQALAPSLLDTAEDAFRLQLPSTCLSGDWAEISAHSTSQYVVERMNNVILVGAELASDCKYTKASMQYTRDVVITGEVLRFTPTSLQTPIGWIAMNWSGAKNRVYDRVTGLMYERMKQNGDKSEANCDLTQWLLESTRKKTPEAITRLAQNVMGLTFGGAHQLPMLISFALVSLCQHPEYMEPLREEIVAFEKTPANQRDYNNLRLMDSFLKETVRLNPTIVLTMPRKVLQPFTFNNGPTVPANDWICVPQHAIMRNQEYYQNPAEFNGFRFLKRDEDSKESSNRLTTPSFDFPFWGGVRKPCPGRFYAATVAKMTLSKFIMEYDFRLVDHNAPTALAWSFALVPHPRTKILMRKRL